MSLVVRKPVFGVSDQVGHKPGCTTTEDGWKLEISDLGRRGIVLLTVHASIVDVFMSRAQNFSFKYSFKDIFGTLFINFERILYFELYMS